MNVGSETGIDQIVAEARQRVHNLKARINQLDDDGLDLLFREARSFHVWYDKPVDEATLRDLYELMKWGPTANNGNPARLLFVISEDAKSRLRPALAAGNMAKMEGAPVTAIIAYDPEYYENFTTLFAHRPEAAEGFRNDPAKAETAAFRNSSLQGAYLMLAARALGLDIGPMSGFNNAVVDDAFFTGTKFKSNFLCNLGYADPDGLLQRLPRYEFNDICQIL